MTPQDQAFIDKIDSDFPGRNIRYKFALYAGLAPSTRLWRAQEDIGKLPRA